MKNYEISDELKTLHSEARALREIAIGQDSDNEVYATKLMVRYFEMVRKFWRDVKKELNLSDDIKYHYEANSQRIQSFE